MNNCGVGFADCIKKHYFKIRARRAHHIYSLFIILYSLSTGIISYFLPEGNYKRVTVQKS